MLTRSLCANRGAIILLLLSAVAVSAQMTTAPASAPAAAPSTAPAVKAALDPEVDRILTQLEDRQVQDLHARLIWRQAYIGDLEEDAVSKRGEIWYQKADPVAKFLIHFTEKSTGTRQDKLDERHFFDGCWYVEVQSRTKTVQWREIRRPNDPVNPYKVGEGVFPLPFGQKKADILREFDVQRVPAAPSDPAGTDHLKLIPHAGTRTGQSYKALDFWVSREGALVGLPLKVQVAKIDGTGKLNSYITITFDDVKLNQGFSSSVFELKTPDDYTTTKETLDDARPPGSP